MYKIIFNSLQILVLTYSMGFRLYGGGTIRIGRINYIGPSSDPWASSSRSFALPSSVMKKPSISFGNCWRPYNDSTPLIQFARFGLDDDIAGGYRHSPCGDANTSDRIKCPDQRTILMFRKNQRGFSLSSGV